MDSLLKRHKLGNVPQTKTQLPKVGEVTEPEEGFGSPSGISRFTVTGVSKPKELEAQTQKGFSSLVSKHNVQTKSKEVTGLTFDAVKADPQRMSDVRNFMINAKGTDYKSKDEDEVLSDFMSHMRYVNTSSWALAKEVADVNWASDDRQKEIYGKGYKVFEEMGSMFSNGDGFSAAADYTIATISDPVTWASGFIGRGFSGAVIKGAAKELTEATTKQAVKNATKTAVNALGNKAASPKVKKIIKEDITRLVAPINGKKAALVTAGFEAAAATAMDVAYQDLLVETNVQDEWNAYQTALVGVGGAALGGAIGLWARPHTKGATGLGGVSGEALEKSVKKRREGAKEVVKTLKPAVEKLVRETKLNWEKSISEGKSFDITESTAKFIFEWFGNPRIEGGFSNFLLKTGVDLKKDDMGGFSKALLEEALHLDQSVKSILDEAFEPLGLRFHQAASIFAKEANKSGTHQHILSSGAKAFDDLKNITLTNKTTAERISDNSSIVNEALEGKTSSPRTMEYIQSVWKRAIVSHIGTTVTNVKGFVAVNSLRSMAQLTQAALLYGAAPVQAMVQGRAAAGRTIGEANALLHSLRYSAAAYVDPFTTTKSFQKLLQDFAPSSIKTKVNTQFFDGVDNRGPAAFGYKSDGKVTGAVEKYIHAAQKLSFVNSQDIMTKSMAGISELDKQVRLSYGKGLTKLLDDGEGHLITDKMWNSTVKALQETTLSKDFSQATGMWGELAKFTQSASSKPIVGFVFPFGQFAVSVMDTVVQYSPLAFMGMGKYMGKEFDKLGFTEAFSKAAVGTTAGVLAYHREKEKMEEGLQWNEERDSSGNVYKTDNLFPIPLVSLVGRIAVHFEQGGDLPKDLITELGRQLVIPEATKEASLTDPLMELAKGLWEAGDEGKSGWETIVELASGAAGVSAGIASGITRPLDAINDSIGVVGETLFNKVDMNDIDRRQLKGLDKVGAELTRYTDNIFKLILGEEGENGYKLFEPKHTASQFDPQRSGNSAAAIFGHNITQRRTEIDKLLGTINKSAFRLDNFTTGYPEYDNWLNDVINPELEVMARSLNNNPNFKKLSLGQKEQVVADKIKEVRNKVLSSTKSPLSPVKEGALLKRRRDLLTRPSGARSRAMKLLGLQGKKIEDLTLHQIESIFEAMSVETDDLNDI